MRMMLRHGTGGGVGPRLQVLATAVLFSTGGAAIKAVGLSSWQIAGFRSGLAALVMAALLPAARRGWTGRVLLVGCAYACALTSYVIANKLTTAANTIFLYSAMPIYVLVLGPWLLREPFHRRDLLVVSFFVGGMVLCFFGTEVPMATAPSPLLGNVVAALGGFFFALTIMGLRWIGRDARSDDNSSIPAVVVGNLIVFAVCLPLALPVRGAELGDWLWIAYLGSVQVGLAYALLTRAVRAVPAMEVSVLLLFEPVLNPIWAWALHRESPSSWTLGGGGLILAAILLSTFEAYRRSRRLPATEGQAPQ